MSYIRESCNNCELIVENLRNLNYETTPPTVVLQLVIKSELLFRITYFSFFAPNNYEHFYHNPKGKLHRQLTTRKMIGALPNSPSNQECQKKSKERGLCGSIPTLDQEMGGHFKMHRTTVFDVERPSSIAAIEQESVWHFKRHSTAVDDECPPTIEQETDGHFKRHTTAVDVERPRMQKSRSIKRVLKAFRANEPKIPFPDVPEGLGSGNLRAEDLFPPPRRISNPYEEDKEFIDGLLFFAPESENAIRSMLGHPPRRPPPSSERP